MQTLQLFSPIEELNGTVIIKVEQGKNNYVRVVRGKHSLPHEFGVYIAREGDEIYIPQTQSPDGHMVIRVGALGSLCLVARYKHFPIVSSSVPISNLFEIGNIESLHFIAKAYLVQRVITADYINRLTCSGALPEDIMSIRRLLYTELRAKEQAQAIYED